MNAISSLFHSERRQDSSKLAAAITKASSQQTYYTIRCFVDRDRVADAYRAYAYFRWVDDILDAETGSRPERIAFLERQQFLLETCYLGVTPVNVSAEEQMLVDMVAQDHEKNSGLRAYLYNMMAVMVFDVERRGRLIAQSELSVYTRFLATAVTEALHYFIGHNCPTPRGAARYQAVSGAHVVHMLRDMLEDTAAGYFNLPYVYIEVYGLSLRVVDSPVYREWVKNRVQLARQYFAAGREYIRQVKNVRCRLAGFAYTARFEWLLRTIEQDGYRLRAEYPERKSLRAGLWMAWTTLKSTFVLPKIDLAPKNLAVQPVRSKR